MWPPGELHAHTKEKKKNIRKPLHRAKSGRAEKRLNFLLNAASLMDDGGKAAVSIMEQVSIMELNSNITALIFNPDSHTWYETTA